MDDGDFPQNGRTIYYHVIGFQPINIAKFIYEVYNKSELGAIQYNSKFWV